MEFSLLEGRFLSVCSQEYQGQREEEALGRAGAYGRGGRLIRGVWWPWRGSCSWTAGPPRPRREGLQVSSDLAPLPSLPLHFFTPHSPKKLSFEPGSKLPSVTTAPAWLSHLRPSGGTVWNPAVPVLGCGTVLITVSTAGSSGLLLCPGRPATREVRGVDGNAPAPLTHLWPRSLGRRLCPRAW